MNISSLVAYFRTHFHFRNTRRHGPMFCPVLRNCTPFSFSLMYWEMELKLFLNTRINPSNTYTCFTRVTSYFTPFFNKFVIVNLTRKRKQEHFLIRATAMNLFRSSRYFDSPLFRRAVISTKVYRQRRNIGSCRYFDNP